MEFPKSIDISVNEVLCHGIPDLRPLKNKDYININVATYINEVHANTSAMVCVGEVH